MLMLNVKFYFYMESGQMKYIHFTLSTFSLKSEHLNK